MSDLISGRRTRDDYIALVAQHYFIYAALESAAERLAHDEVVARFVSPSLLRTPALELDLEFLIGSDWRDSISPLPTTSRYVERIHHVAATWPGGFVAHHYTRYLGDLSGGRIICRVMQRQFGFETNGVGFYLFESIADPRSFKDRYRQELDSVGWSEKESDRVVDEVMTAYRFNTDLFAELAARGGNGATGVGAAS